MIAEFQYAPFSEDLQPLRNTLTELLPILEPLPDWYGSIYFERKASRSLSATLKQTQLNEHVSSGVVFRVYDGYTLFEEATDELEAKQLKSFAQAFVKRIQAHSPTVGAEKRPYRPPTWSERTSVPLEKEITSQLPADLKSKTPVHFGIRYHEDPRQWTTETAMTKLKDWVAKCQDLSLKQGFSAGQLSYVQSRYGFVEEESLFIDRETNMSQTLYRLSLTMILMSGSDRTYCKLGGLGGLEAIRLQDSQIISLLKDLKALKTAERLQPGKYRVLFGPIVTGVLAHEAFGHAQEGDTCARGRSKAWDLHHSKVRVGNEHATILNNPAIFENGGEPYAAWGSYFFDEEGWLAQEQVLLDRGQLLAPMTNLTSALRLGVARTANGKRESWANGVYTRQTNTYFSPGNQTLEELMQKLGDGFVALHPAGGMEDPKGMGIQVGISYLEEVRSGRLTGRVFKGPAGGEIQMTGYTPDVLNSIVGKSKIEADSRNPDRAKHPFNDAGGCGKYHKEFVFAGCGGPYLLLDQVILG